MLKYFYKFITRSAFFVFSITVGFLKWDKGLKPLKKTSNLSIEIRNVLSFL